MDRQAVTAQLDQELISHNLYLTEQAREIVIQCIVAIADDAEPSWSSPPNTDVVQTHAISGLITKLSRLVHVLERQSIPTLGTKIRTFQILHLVSRWVDELCPFEKPAGQTGTTTSITTP